MVLKRATPLLVLCMVIPGMAPAADSWWLTADQQGQQMLDQQRFDEAAEVFEDPFRKGVAYYRAGEFEKAASAFGRVASADAFYNPANALLFLGRYEEAIAGYDQALRTRPGWRQAEENRRLAGARLAALAPPEDDAGGTGGQLEADEIVFDETGRVNQGGTEVDTAGGDALTDEEMRKVWLRRVDNRPAEFLRARFAYQLYREAQDE
jgi:Ca-activated chloride channel family protein